ncbi:MAG: DUF1854 domain-containing protein [candidate division Zixibacteria bacterium]|nr:DUF1854 domain-containing protein [candidate division Zixibacteria bacterium]
MIQTIEETPPTAPNYPVPPATIHPEHVEAGDIRLFRNPPWRLRMSLTDRSYLKVKIVRAAPLSHPSQYICFLDEKDEVIAMVKEPSDLEKVSHQIVREELDQRYLTAVVLQVHSVKSEFGISYWDVETSRGRREFVIQNVSEAAQWFGETHLMLVDVDGNRFEIPDMTALDKKSLGYIGLVL